MLVDDYCHYTAYVSTQGLQPPNPAAAAILGRQLLEVPTIIFNTYMCLFTF